MSYCNSLNFLINSAEISLSIFIKVGYTLNSNNAFAFSKSLINGEDSLQISLFLFFKNLLSIIP